MRLIDKDKDAEGDYTFTFPENSKYEMKIFDKLPGYILDKHPCKIPDIRGAYPLSYFNAYHLLTFRSYNCLINNYEKKTLKPNDQFPLSHNDFPAFYKARWIPNIREVNREMFPKVTKIIPNNEDCNNFIYEPKNIQNLIERNWKDIALEFYKQYDEVELCNVAQERIFRYFGNTPNPFDKLKIPCGEYTQVNFDDYDTERNALLMHIPEFTRLKNNVTIENLDNYIDFVYIHPMVRCCTFLPEFEKRFHTFKNIFSFKNEHGECIMKVVKVYYASQRIFSLLAYTQWISAGTTRRELYQVPIKTGKQPLYNLDLLVKDRHQDKIIILTDSIETADYMQEKCPYEGVVFTSFICEPGKYEQVDWEPLKNSDSDDEAGHLEIVYLITNHSGIELEDKYLEAEELIQYLDDKEHIKINNFWQRRIEYPDLRCCYESLEDFIQATLDNPAQVYPVFEMDRNDFEKACQKAHVFRSKKPIFFDAQTDVETTETAKPEEKNEDGIPDFILYPVLSRNDMTLLIGPQKSRKSLMALAIAMIATNSDNQNVKPLFREVIWNITKKTNEKHKVLYLDFENGLSEMKRRLDSFKSYYWPQAKESQQKCRDNLIIKTQDKLPEKCTSTEGLSKLFEIIDAAKKQGEPEQEVDILIIDSLGGFNGNDSSISNEKEFKGALNAIRSRYSKMATLMIHHISTDSSKSNPARGKTASFDNFQYQILISKGKRDEERDDELYVNIDQSRSGCAISKEQFKVACPEGTDSEKFKVIEDYGGEKLTDENKDSIYKKNLRKVVDFFKTKGIKQPKIAKVLGMSERTLSTHLKKN